ncbi:MAG: RNA polymerase sigma factor [Gammaproteobacteria bacterium]|nr:RNA polymerase sigma factor [Gammaproteobacteria bacterium]
MDAPADEQLMLAYRDGDARAFDTLYDRHKAPLYRYLLRQCRIAAVAEELFQDVWTNLIKARARYEVRAKFTTYLYRLAHNRLIDYYRQQAAGMPISYEDDPDDSPADSPAGRAPEGELDTRRQARRLLVLIAQLPEAQREAFLLREEGGLSLEEIADATGVNAETAKSRLRYAVAKLREGMRQAGHVSGTEAESA